MTGGSRYLPSKDDGLPTRVSGPWAQEKLAYLRKYMEIFNGGMKNKWDRVFLDLMAGPGRCVDEHTGEEFDGSPLLALSCPEPFTEVVLVEDHPDLAEALEQRVAGRASVIPENCNSRAVIERMRDRLGYGRLGLAFVDNLGLDVSLDTISQLSDRRKVDLCITFHTGDLRRNLERARNGEDADRWTAFFGSEEWRLVADEAARLNLAAADTATRLLDFYGEQLRRLGYEHVTHSRRAMRNSRNVDLYRLILAGKHERAVQFFEEISRIDPAGQRSFW